MKNLVFSVLIFSFATQASASLGGSEQIESPADTKRIEALSLAWKNGDFDTYLNMASSDEIAQLIQGTVADGYASRLAPNASLGKYKQVFKIYLNGNNRGQSLLWFDHGKFRKAMKVSGAGIPGKFTPRGNFTAHNLDRNAFSQKFQSPMPCAFFFTGGGSYAVHGTTHVDHLGAPASNGCVRVDPKELCPIFDEIQGRGEGSSVLIQIQESPDGLY